MENTSNPVQELSQTTPVVTADAFREHWQGHRQLTRRVIEAFPEDKLFTHAIGGMRPFSELTIEMIQMAAPGIRGIATGQWETYGDLSGFIEAVPQTKAELLKLWDKVTGEIDAVWPQVLPHRFAEVEAAFGQYEQPNYCTLLYMVDNEVHHRGQGYVYLRSLGIEPPPFWERG